MSVHQQIIAEGWRATWELVVGQSLTSIMVAICVFILVVIAARFIRGKDYANDWIFDGVAGVIALILVGLIMFAVETFFIVPAKIISNQQYEIADLSIKTNSLSSEISALSNTTNELQRQHERDSSALEAVAAVTGATNGTFIQNAENMMDKITAMATNLENINKTISAPKSWESFVLSDTNRVTVLISSNAGPTLFFKLKHPALNWSASGIIQIPNMNQVPMAISGQNKNVVYAHFPDMEGLDHDTFEISYLVDKGTTTIFHSLSTHKGHLVVDGKIINLLQNEEQ